jgi:RNA polymerase sigma factor (sigma-70 family)
VHRYSRPPLRYCSRLLPTARAEDAVQQAFLSAHRAIHAGDAELNLRPWLYRIAHNASLNLLRQNGFDHDQVSEEIDGVETPAQAFERGERLRTVVAAVQELPERQRSAIVLQAVEGRSYDEIASELGVTDGAVRQLLNRARTTLRDGVGALTPTGLITRLAAGEGSPLAERVAAVVGSAGGGALLAKAGVAIVVAGAVAGGGAAVESARDTPRPRAAQGVQAAVQAPAREAAVAGRVRLMEDRVTADGQARRGRRLSHAGDDHASHSGDDGRRAGRGSRDDHGSGGDTAADDRSGSDDHSGSGGSDDRSGSGDHSGSGSGDDGGSSGSGSGDSGSGSSGSGSGDSSGPGDSGSSGSGDDGGTSGGSGSGTSGSGTSGSGTSGSGTSGSGTAGSDDRIDGGSGTSSLDSGTSGSGDGGGTSRSGRG